jgi:hypothetical protein
MRATRKSAVLTRRGSAAPSLSSTSIERRRYVGRLAASLACWRAPGSPPAAGTRALTLGPFVRSTLCALRYAKAAVQSDAAFSKSAVAQPARAKRGQVCAFEMASAGMLMNSSRAKSDSAIKFS